jgi:Na+-transporting NADH:ubiquinone oxidoreductase subunit NqrC
MELDIFQAKQIRGLIIAFGALSAVVAVLVYADQRKHNKVQQEILSLDKEIKLLQLAKLQNGQSI